MKGQIFHHKKYEVSVISSKASFIVYVKEAQFMIKTRQGSTVGIRPSTRHTNRHVKCTEQAERCSGNFFGLG